MKGQIRAPKARKVNSYMIAANLTISNYLDCNVSEFSSLVKQNSANLLSLNGCSDPDQICFDCDLDEQVNKLSVISEIKQIKMLNFNQTDYKIERCLNPFTKNFIAENSNIEESIFDDENQSEITEHSKENPADISESFIRRDKTTKQHTLKTPSNSKQLKTKVKSNKKRKVRKEKAVESTENESPILEH